MELLERIDLILLGVYIITEIILRIIPDKDYNGPTGKIIDALKWLSDAANRRRKEIKNRKRKF